MRLTVLNCLIIMVISTLLLLLLSHLNETASDSRDEYAFTTFNRSAQDSAQAIMQYWRAADYRKNAVTGLVLTDYIFMLVYCPFICAILLSATRHTSLVKLRKWCTVAVYFIVAGTIIDAVQDTIILKSVHMSGQMASLTVLTTSKWLCFLIGCIPLIIILFQLVVRHRKMILRYLSETLKSLWLFFPAVLFLLLFIVAFWSLGQGKDILVAFTSNRTLSFHMQGRLFNYNRLFIVLAIAFWAYVTWYFSRIIAEIKECKQQEPVDEIRAGQKNDKKATYEGQTYPDIRKNALDFTPRLLGNACFLVAELAALQLPIFAFPISASTSWIILLVGSVLFYFLNRWLERKLTTGKAMTRLFGLLRGLLYILSAFLIITCFFPYIWVSTFIGIIVLLHAIFIVYTHYRRLDIDKKTKAVQTNIEQPYDYSTLMGKLMHYFNINRHERNYFNWLIIISAVGSAFYLAAIIWLQAARIIGPLSFIMFGFGVLLGAASLVTAFSVKYKVNFHLLLWLLALALGIRETHKVNIIKLTDTVNHYSNRPSLPQYLDAWLNRWAPKDTSQDIRMYFIMSNGGASRSGYWTASVLGKLQDTSSFLGDRSRFSDHIFCLSGTSGGGVGVTGFFSLLRNTNRSDKHTTRESLQNYLKQDYFTYTFARLLGPDFFHYISITGALKRVDRARALERSFTESATEDTRLQKVPFDDSLSKFPALEDNRYNLPILCVNTTRMQDGNPGVVTNLKLDSYTFNNRIDVLSLLKDKEDISVATGAILGARFPYISPAGNIADNYFVDGGYFDNSGAGIVQEMIHGILAIGQQHRNLKDTLYARIRHIQFKVIHIVNSPTISDVSKIKPVPSITNDLFAPLLTIVGAYDMQTTVNDERLKHYLADIDSSGTGNHAKYCRISLYKEINEWPVVKPGDRMPTEAAYPMNWYISDTILSRMNNRLDSVSGKLVALLNNVYADSTCLPKRR